MKNIEAMRIMLPPDDETSDARLELLLEQAENTLLDYIGRRVLPEKLNYMAVQLAVIMLNRLGNEGEDKRTEGDVSVSFSSFITNDMKQRLKNYPRKVGAVNCS